MECHCIVLHATTPEDRERVVKELDRARHAGDSKTITLCSLSSLPAVPEQDRAARCYRVVVPYAPMSALAREPRTLDYSPTFW